MKLFLMDGFLGSGKTTAIAKAAQMLVAEGKPVAVITNDQGLQQVDSAYIKSLHLQTAEVAQGCFCCRFDQLVETIETLRRSGNPEVIFAEAVGSCTDIVATVVKPLQEKYNDIDALICTFADVYLLYSLINGTSAFIDESVQYIFRKQMEEADIIVLNKCDLLQTEELAKVKAVLNEEYAGKTIISQDAYNADHIKHLLNTLSLFVIPQQRRSLGIDYDIYGAGEAVLAWLDMEISLHARNFSAIKAGLLLAELIDQRIRSAHLTTGHLKFLFEYEGHVIRLSFTTTGVKQKVTDEALNASNHINILINARVQTNPAILTQIIQQAIETTITVTGCRIVIHASSAFSPGYPMPVHRMA